MASKAPGQCCIEGTFHEGTPAGEHKTIFGLDTYQTGVEHGKDRIIVILTDIYGNHFNNTLLVADQLAKSGKYQVLVPDILKGDPVPETHGDLGPWLKNHTPAITKPIITSFLDQLVKEYSPKFIAGFGYCFGAKYAILEGDKNGRFDVVAIAHPSFVEIEEVQALAKPIIISAAETDPIFTTDLRHQSEIELAKLSASKGLRYQIDLYSGVAHGYAVRGDTSDPVVRYAKEKTVMDQLSFLAQFSKQSKL